MRRFNTRKRSNSEARMRKKPIAIVIEGYYGHGSAGDEAILEGLVTAIRRLIPSVNITVISHDADSTHMIHHVKSVNRNFKQWICEIPQSIHSSDCFIFGGGNLLTDETFYTLPLCLARIILVKLFRKRFIICAQGIGPINTLLGRLLVRIGASIVDAITVRDLISTSYLSQIRVPLFITADSAFSVKMADLDDTRKISKDEEVTKDRPPSIGIALRSPIYFRPAEPTSFEEIMAEVVDYLIQEFQAKITFIPLLKKRSIQDSDYHIIDDFAVISSVLAKMKHRKHACIVESELTPSQLIALFDQFDLLIGVPLHSFIFATRTGTPFIAINYHPKVKEFLRMIHYEKAFQVDIDELRFRVLIDKLERVWLLSENVREHLLSISKKLEKRANKNAEVLMEVLARAKV